MSNCTKNVIILNVADTFFFINSDTLMKLPPHPSDTHDIYSSVVNIQHPTEHLLYEQNFTIKHLQPTTITIAAEVPQYSAHRITDSCLELDKIYILHIKTKHHHQHPGSLSSAQLIRSIVDTQMSSVKYQFTFTISSRDDLKYLNTLLNFTRKHDHLTICSELYQNQQHLQTSSHSWSSPRTQQFDHIRFVPQTIVDFNFNDIDLSTQFLGRKFQLPLIITAMTGGIEQGRLINLMLAQAASQYGIPLSVGSQRIALEQPHLEQIFALKPYFNELFLIGNLGISQLTQPHNSAAQLGRCIEMIQADAIGIHCNLIQELIQPEGNKTYTGLWHNLAQSIQTAAVPVIIKEIGSGMSAPTINRLAQLGADAIDVGGRGGLSWAAIEGLRTQDPIFQAIGKTFSQWGMSTAESLSRVQSAQLQIPLIATGGIRSGLMAAQALRAGAHMVGMGMPLLQAVLNDITTLTSAQLTTLNHSEAATEEVTHLLSTLPLHHLNQTIKTWIQELKITLMITGCQTLEQLKSAPLIQNQPNL